MKDFIGDWAGTILLGALAGAIGGAGAAYGWIAFQTRSEAMAMVATEKQIENMRLEDGGMTLGQLSAENAEAGERIAALRDALREENPPAPAVVNTRGPGKHRYTTREEEFARTPLEVLAGEMGLPPHVATYRGRERVGRFFSLKLAGAESPSMSRDLIALERGLLKLFDNRYLKPGALRPKELAPPESAAELKSALGPLLAAVQQDMILSMAADFGKSAAEEIDAFSEAFWYANKSHLFNESTNAERAALHWQQQSYLLRELAQELGINQELRLKAFERQFRAAIEEPLLSPSPGSFVLALGHWH